MFEYSTDAHGNTQIKFNPAAPPPAAPDAGRAGALCRWRAGIVIGRVTGKSVNLINNGRPMVRGI